MHHQMGRRKTRHVMASYPGCMLLVAYNIQPYALRQFSTTRTAPINPNLIRSPFSIFPLEKRTYLPFFASFRDHPAISQRHVRVNHNNLTLWLVCFITEKLPSFVHTEHRYYLQDKQTCNVSL